MTCACIDFKPSQRIHVKANFTATKRIEMFRGRRHLVVPVVMLKETVVNGALVKADALVAEAWNGVPVTVSHPTDKGQAVSANSPKTLEKWQVGTIFNAKVEEGKLKAEAWVDIDLADSLAPGLVKALRSGAAMDVSTGYFTTAQKNAGEYEGRPYTEVHSELKPDHLALLPDEEGACSWKDGCGVRANHKRKTPMANVTLKKILVALAGDKKTKTIEEDKVAAHDAMVDTLIEDSNTPFEEADRETLTALPDVALEAIAEKMLGEEGESEVNSEGDKEKDVDSNKNRQKTVANMTADDLTKLIANVSSDAAKKAVTEALALNERQELEAKILANKSLGLDAEDLKSLPIKTMKKLAAKMGSSFRVNGDITTKTNFGGRCIQTQSESGSEKKFPGLSVASVRAPVADKDKKTA